MYRLFIRLFLLATLVLTTYAAIILFIHFNSASRFFAATIDKHAVLQSTSSPKIIIVGGSSAALGIDSPLIERKLGRPVVNMGLHGGLGLRYMLDEIKPYIHKDDLVLVMPEYQAFYGLLDGDTTLLDVLYIYPEGIRYLNSPFQFFDLLSKIPASIQEQLVGVVGNIVAFQPTLYTRSGFNSNGDMVAHLNQQTTLDLTGKTLFSSDRLTFDENAITVLENFNNYTRQQHSQMLFVFPPIPDSVYQANEKEIQQVWGHLKNSTILVIGTPSDYTLSVDYFYDTLYHLNAKGRAQRTGKILQAIERQGLANIPYAK